MSKNGVKIYRFLIHYDQIIFEDTHQYCLNLLKNGKPCPAHGNNWACPPVSPTFGETKEKLKRYTQFLVIIYEFDLGVWKEQLRQKHPEWNDRKLENNAKNSHLYNGVIYWGLRKLLKPYLNNLNTYVLGNADCRRCKGGCAKRFNGLCRHPKDRIYSMEASGINVDESLRKVGYELQWDSKAKVCQVGLICFKYENPLMSR